MTLPANVFCCQMLYKKKWQYEIVVVSTIITEKLFWDMHNFTTQINTSTSWEAFRNVKAINDSA